MDEEDTRDYNEPCAQCSEVHWGITDEGKFYCKSCHNVIEKTKEIASSDVFTPNAKILSVAKGTKKKKQLDKGFTWYICEGFQYVLKEQVEALVTLGVCPQIKDEILCNLWRRYLQKSHQAYTARPVHSLSRRVTVQIFDDSQGSSESGCEPASPGLSDLHSFLESEGETEMYYSDTSLESHRSTSKSIASDDVESCCSGSIDGSSYRSERRDRLLMTMPMTLAFCYMALLWLRESITLADLLRFVAEGHIPYINTFQYFPEEMKLYGPDVRLFQVESLPSYEEIQRKMHRLAVFLDLPRFPPVTEKCFLHPDILCIRYLMEANLPDEMQRWTCKMSRLTGIGDVAFLTYDPLARKSRTINYDVLAVALIVVVLKLLFVLDDKSEWLLSNIAETENARNKEGIKCFVFRKWYKTTRSCLEETEKKMEEEVARQIWKSEKPLFYSLKEKSLVHKKRRMVVNLQRQFDRLTGSVQKKQSPSSFQFIWDEENPDRTCFHGHSLKCFFKKKNGLLAPLNRKYWLCSLKQCRQNTCKHLSKSEEANFSGSYLFILNLFSFLLRVDISTLHEEVESIEHKLAKKYRPRMKRKAPRKKLWKV